MRLIPTLLALVLLLPIQPALARVVQTVKVTKTVTVRTVTTRKIIRITPRIYIRRHPVHYVYRRPDHLIYRRRVIFVRRFHPESCFLSPVAVVALNALGPYCDSPRGWHRAVIRY